MQLYSLSLRLLSPFCIVSNGRHVGLRVLVTGATVAVNLVCVGEQRTCETCVCSPYCPTSCHCMTEKHH